MEKYISAKDIAIKINKTSNIVIEKFKSNYITPIKIGQKFYYNEKNIPMLLNENKDNITPYRKQLLIIEYYLRDKENTPLKLSQLSGMNQMKVERVISDFFKNDNCIIAESEMNNL